MNTDDIQIVNNPKDIEKLMTPKEDEFAKTMAEIQRLEAEKAKKKAEAPPEPKSEPKPIKLEYLFSGTDENGHNVETIELDIEDKHFITAFCPICKKQIITHQVANLKHLNKELPKVIELVGGIKEEKMVKAQKAINEERAKKIEEKHAII